MSSKSLECIPSIAVQPMPLHFCYEYSENTIATIAYNMYSQKSKAKKKHVDISPPPLESPGLLDPSSTPLRQARGTPGGDRRPDLRVQGPPLRWPPPIRRPLVVFRLRSLPSSPRVRLPEVHLRRTPLVSATGTQFPVGVNKRRARWSTEQDNHCLTLAAALAQKAAEENIVPCIHRGEPDSR